MPLKSSWTYFSEGYRDDLDPVYSHPAAALATGNVFRASALAFFMRAIALLIGILGIVLVAQPEWSTVASQALGVGRGADLITYLGLVGLSFVCLLLYSKMRFLEAHLTSLIRTAAIAGAHSPTTAPRGNSGAPPDATAKS